MKEWFLGLEPRERRILVTGAVVAVLAMLYGAVIDPLYSAVAQRRESVRQNSALLRWMQQTAATATPAGVSTGTQRPAGGSLVVEFSRQTDRAGLGPYVKETRPNGTNGVRVRFEEVPFDRLMQLMSQLESASDLRVVSASVERGKVPGTINTRLTLTRS
jgi:type II secretory pathway component PulM